MSHDYQDIEDRLLRMAEAMEEFAQGSLANGVMPDVVFKMIHKYLMTAFACRQHALNRIDYQERVHQGQPTGSLSVEEIQSLMMNSD